ncbi:MAG TPA: hypothetical protein VGR43_11535 [Dehalococcoidia bacterium]|jgi:hypothetical protein|nr:hypothetical protein [Dehalococcoidia bacterium]
MKAVSRLLLPAVTLGVIAFAAACGSGDKTPDDQFAGFFRPGVYTRTDGDKTYEINLGGAGLYSLKLNGADYRAGSYTLVGTSLSPEDINKAFAFIDEAEGPTQCAEEDEPGVYKWSFTETTMKLDAFRESCDQRKDELESGDWLRQPDPSSTPAPAASP